MTKPQKIEGGWEQKFDNFDHYSGDEYNDACPLAYARVLPNAKCKCQMKDIKDFISDLLASERQRCVEAIENNMPRYLKGGEIRNQYFAKGWNEAIDQAKHNLEQMK